MSGGGAEGEDGARATRASAGSGRWERLRAVADRHPTLSAGLLDGLLPLFAYLILVMWGASRLIHQIDSHAVLPSSAQPDDSTSTVWFYWWVYRAWADGRTLLEPDMVCAPGWESLGKLFANRVDALAAVPFFASFPFPRSYNLFILSALTFSAWSGYLFCRTLTRNRLVAGAIGALFVYNLYTFWEINHGRPNTGILAWYALFGAAWVKALVTPGRAAWGWVVLAGLAAALTVHAYVIVAFFLVFFAVGLALFRVFWPAAGVSRLRPVWAGLLSVGIAAFWVAPYVHETQVLRDPISRISDADPGQRAPLWPWDPTMWQELGRWWETRTPGTGLGPDAMELAQTRALPLISLIGLGGGPTGSPAGATRPVLLAMVGLVLLGGRRTWPWALGVAFFYLCTLGPYVAEAVGRPPIYVEMDGQRLRTPIWWVLQAAPMLAEYIRPYRVFVVAWLCTVGLFMTGFDGLSTRLARWLPRAAPWLVGLLAIGLAAETIRQGRRIGSFSWVRTAIEVPPFIQDLGENPEDFAIVELPVGLGEGGATWQVVHQKRRAGSFRQVLPEQTDRCMSQLPFLRQMTTLPPAPTSEATDQAIAQGFRYVLVRRELLKPSFTMTMGEQKLLAPLTAQFGEPIYEDPLLLVWDIRRTP